MNIRKKTLNEVYEHLHNHCGLHTKSDFADILEVRRAGLYSALNGNEAYLTDSLFRKICTKYQGMFDINYLLTGKGKLLLEQTDKAKQPARKENDTEQKTLLSGIENLLDISSKQIKENEELRRQLQSSIDDLNHLIAELKSLRKVNRYDDAILMVAEPDEEMKK